MKCGDPEFDDWASPLRSPIWFCGNASCERCRGANIWAEPRRKFAYYEEEAYWRHLNKSLARGVAWARLTGTEQRLLTAIGETAFSSSLPPVKEPWMRGDTRKWRLPES